MSFNFERSKKKKNSKNNFLVRKRKDLKIKNFMIFCPLAIHPLSKKKKWRNRPDTILQRTKRKSKKKKKTIGKNSIFCLDMFLLPLLPLLLLLRCYLIIFKSIKKLPLLNSNPKISTLISLASGLNTNGYTNVSVL